MWYMWFTQKLRDENEKPLYFDLSDGQRSQFKKMMSMNDNNKQTNNSCFALKANQNIQVSFYSLMQLLLGMFVKIDSLQVFFKKSKWTYISLNNNHF